MERQKLILGLQAVSAVGILVLGLLSFFGQSTRELRVEMQEGFATVREEMRDEFAAVRKEMRDEFAAVRKEMRDEFAAIRTEMKDMNTRLSRVEGYLGISEPVMGKKQDSR